MSETPAKPAPQANTPKPGDRGYKRSWKNLLINKRYQLQFTLFMVGLATVLMVGLGIRVMMKANEATTVTKVHWLGMACPEIPTLPIETTTAGAAAAAATPDPAAGSGSAVIPETVLEEVASQWCNDDEFTCTEKPAVGKPLVVKLSQVGSAAQKPTECDETLDYKLGDGDALSPLHKAGIKVVSCDGGKKHDVPVKARRAKPTIDEESIQLTPTTVPTGYYDPFFEKFKTAIAERGICEMKQADELAAADRARMMILLVLIASGLVLVGGLGVYGIKMTHKVAGPLFKISLYLGKMRDGRYDKVWNLRKGDQLVAFYDNFKVGHEGVVQMQREDIVRVKAVIAAAETAGMGDHATIVKLREMLARKEKSIE